MKSALDSLNETVKVSYQSMSPQQAQPAPPQQAAPQAPPPQAAAPPTDPSMQQQQPPPEIPQAPPNQSVPAEALQALEEQMHQLADAVSQIGTAFEQQQAINKTLTEANAGLKKELEAIKNTTSIILRELEKSEPVNQLAQLVLAMHDNAGPPQGAQPAQQAAPSSPAADNAQPVQPQQSPNEPVSAPALPGPEGPAAHQPASML